MPIWDKTGKLPQNLNAEDKRNVVVTDIGFIRRRKYTDMHGNQRVKEEIYNAISGLANTSNWGAPKVVGVYHNPENPQANTSVDTFVFFSEPIRANTATKLVVSNVTANTSINAVANTSVFYADNALLYKWTTTTAGTYKIGSQTIANNGAASGQYIISLNAGNESANRAISDVVSNTSVIIVS